MLTNAIVDYIGKHKAAYGTQYIKPKLHWLLDIPQQLTRDKLVLDAFVIERTHLTVKHLAEQIDNTSVFERSVMASLASTVWQRATEDPPGNGLLGRTAPAPELAGAFVSDKMVVYAVELCVDDIVCSRGELGVVAACGELEGKLYLLVKPLTVVRHMSGHTKLAAPADGIAAWDALDVRLCLAWRRHGANQLLVVLE